MQALSIGGEFRFARCWDIERNDGTHFRFTDHDHSLVVSGNTFTPAVAMDASAVRSSDGGDPDNFKAFGVIDSGTVTQADLEAGLFRGAKVTEYVVDHRYPWAGVFANRVFFLTDLKYNTETKVWEAECRGLLHKLEKTRGHRYHKTCRWEFGSTECGVTKASYSATFTISAVTSNKVFTATPSAHDDSEYFIDGTIVWSGGNNNGLTSFVKKFTASSDEWVLQLAPPYEVQVGDTATVYAGCNHLSGINEDGTEDGIGDCKNKFNNLNNFGGFPFLPGNDRWLWSPDTKREEDAN